MNAAAPPSAPIDRKSAWKILISVVVVVTAVGALLFSSGLEGAEHYKFVDEVMKNPAVLQGKRIRVHGFVKEESLLKETGTLNHQFVLESRTPRDAGHIKVYYRGLAPDTFKSGAEAVATGILNDKNELVADKLEAKCPSKYEGKTAGYTAEGVDRAPAGSAAAPAAKYPGAGAK